MPKQVPGQAFLAVQSKIVKAADQMEKTQYQVAEKLLFKALLMNPNESKALFLYSICLRIKGNQAHSEQLLQRATKLNPCFFQTNNNQQDKIIKCIKQNYNSATKSMQNNSKTNDFRWQEIVNLFAKAKDLDTTLQVNILFQKLRKQDDKEYTAHLFSTIGISYYEIGLYEQSLAKYATAIKLKSTEYKYYNNSAILMYIKGQYQKSQEFVAKSLTHNPGYPKSLFILAFSLCKIGQIDQALQKIKYSLQKDSKSTMYRFKAITTLLLHFPDKVQQIKKQLSETKQIIDNNQDPDVYFWCKDNRPILIEAISFLNMAYQSCGIFGKQWKDYLLLLDDYLIKGHTDKYKISIQLRKIEQDLVKLLEANKEKKLSEQSISGEKQICKDEDIDETVHSQQH